MRRVASFSCPCGGQDEVREPAPVAVDCWSCKGQQSMRRWQPAEEPPLPSARKVTPQEFARIGTLNDVPLPPKPPAAKAQAKAKAEKWKPNPGYCPKDAEGKRVRVKRRAPDGTLVEPTYADRLDPMAPPGYKADGRGAGNIWSIKGSPFDMVEYLVIR